MHLLSTLKPKAGMRIGLLGGSFDPPHIGHYELAKQAQKHLNLDRVWWMVTPINPLKFAQNRIPAPQMDRRDAVRKMIGRSPKMDVLALPDDIMTYKTLHRLRRDYPQVQFIWLMGWDAFLHIHQWDRWHILLKQHRLALFDRVGYNGVMHAPAEIAFFKDQTSPHHVFRERSAWCRVRVRLPDISSTEIRAGKKDPR